jgi:hypothetical protein
MTSRKKPGVAFWATVVLGVGLALLVAYPLSMGPVWWLCHQIPLPESVHFAINEFYDPVWEARWNGPDWFRDTMGSHLHWWMIDQSPVPGPV